MTAICTTGDAPAQPGSARINEGTIESTKNDSGCCDSRRSSAAGSVGSMGTEHCGPVAGRRESTYRRLLRVRDTIDRDVAQPWTTESLARIALLSPTHFRRRFTAAFGEAPRAYLYRRRIERAASLLRTTSRPVTEIAGSVGYNSLGTFTRTFTRLMGETPTRHRARGPLPEIPACVARAWARPTGTATPRAEKVVPEKP